MPGFLADVLSQSGNGYYILAIKTALTWGDTPMDVLIPKHTRREYGDLLDYDLIDAVDVKLKMAWQILKDETCQQCGQPLWICHNPDRYIGFTVDSTVCFAEQAIEEYKKGHKEEDGKGRIYFAKPYMYDKSMPLPSRFAYMQKLAADEDDGDE